MPADARHDAFKCLDTLIHHQTSSGCDAPDSHHYVAAPARSTAPAISSATAATKASSSPSTITRISGSVPELRTSTRPPSPRRNLAASTVRCTSASSSGAPP